MSTTVRVAPELSRPVRDRVVWGWAAAVFLSRVGDLVWTVGLAWAAVQVAGPAVAGVVVAAGMLPQAALLLVGGTVADRFDPRRVVVACAVAQAVALLLGAALWSAGLPRVSVLLGLELVLGACAAFHDPAAGTLPRTMVAPGDLAALAGLFQVVRRCAAFVGAGVGGGIAAATGPAPAMALDAATFVVVAMVVAALLRPRFPLRRSAPEPVLRAVADGLRYVRSDPTARTLTLALSGLNVFVGPALSIGVALRVHGSGWSAGMLGASEAAVGAGAALGALVAMRVRPRWPARAGFVALVVQGLGIAGTGVASRPVLVASAAAIGVTAGFASVLLSATFQRVVREEQLGRVGSLTMLSDYTLLPLATPLFGWLAHVAGLTVTALMFGLGMVVLSAWSGSRTVVRRLR